MALTRTSAWSLGTMGVCVALSAASWFLLIEPERAEAAATREQTVVAEQSNAQLEVRIEQLRREFADLPSRQAELVAIREALPDEPALAALIREIDVAAADTGVTLDALTSGAATAVVDPAAVGVVDAGTAAPEAGTEPTGSASAAPGAEPTPESSAAPADPAAGVPPAGVPAAGVTAAGVAAVPGAPAGAVLASVPITIDTTAGFAQSNLFVKAVQADISRALLIDSLTLTVLEGEEAVEPGTVKTTLSARVFVFVDPDSVGALDPVILPSE